MYHDRITIGSITTGISYVVPKLMVCSILVQHRSNHCTVYHLFTGKCLFLRYEHLLWESGYIEYWQMRSPVSVVLDQVAKAKPYMSQRSKTVCLHMTSVQYTAIFCMSRLQAQSSSSIQVIQPLHTTSFCHFGTLPPVATHCGTYLHLQDAIT